MERGLMGGKAKNRASGNLPQAPFHEILQMLTFAPKRVGRVAPVAPPASPSTNCPIGPVSSRASAASPRPPAHRWRGPGCPVHLAAQPDSGHPCAGRNSSWKIRPRSAVALMAMRRAWRCSGCSCPNLRAPRTMGRCPFCNARRAHFFNGDNWTKRCVSAAARQPPLQQPALEYQQPRTRVRLRERRPQAPAPRLCAPPVLASRAARRPHRA